MYIATAKPSENWRKECVMDSKKSELVRFRCTPELRNAIELSCRRSGMSITEFMEVSSQLLCDYLIANATPSNLRRINEYGAEFARKELKIAEEN